MDKTNEIKKLIDEIAKKQVYVGIPEQENTEHGTIKNAELLYIQTHGIRSREMINEMNQTMGIDSSGMPYTTDYNDFLTNMGKGMPYSTAYQLYIHAHGSALWRSPPRPVLEPSIEYNKESLTKQLKKVAQAALDGQDPNVELQKSGMMAQNFAREWFTNPANRWPPNADSTVERKGSDRPLIDTGQLRRAITYVVKEGS